MAEPSVATSIAAILDHLGIARTHVAAQMPADISEFIAGFTERVSRVVLVAPPRVDPAAFQALAGDLLYIAPSGGTLARTAGRALPQLANAQHAELGGYSAESWSDLAADRPELGDIIGAHCLAEGTTPTVQGRDETGSLNGVRFSVFGEGPALVLTPMAFAQSQWKPALANLAKRFRVVVLTGPRLGMLALLEQRAALADWRAMCATLFGALELSPADNVLDVGCGSGAVSQQFITHTRKANPLTAIDMSGYFLEEAELAANEAGLKGCIDFSTASAEALPFDENSFDGAYSITVLEECDAATALSELARVVKPGRRVAVAVRGIDLPQWWNMPMPDALRDKIALPAPSVGEGGVASSELYDMAIANGLKPIRMFTYAVASESEVGPVFEFPETYALSLLSSSEQDVFRKAKAAAIAGGTLFMTRGHHCFVGEVTG